MKENTEVASRLEKFVVIGVLVCITIALFFFIFKEKNNTKHASISDSNYNKATVDFVKRKYSYSLEYVISRPMSVQKISKYKNEEINKIVTLITNKANGNKLRTQEILIEINKNKTKMQGESNTIKIETAKNIVLMAKECIKLTRQEIIYYKNLSNIYQSKFNNSTENEKKIESIKSRLLDLNKSLIAQEENYITMTQALDHPLTHKLKRC